MASWRDGRERRWRRRQDSGSWWWFDALELVGWLLRGVWWLVRGVARGLDWR